MVPVKFMARKELMAMVNKNKARPGAKERPGSPGPPAGDTFRPPADLTQEDHVPGLPLGTRGGLVVSYNFPRDGEYEFQIHLTRDD